MIEEWLKKLLKEVLDEAGVSPEVTDLKAKVTELSDSFTALKKSADENQELLKKSNWWNSVLAILLGLLILVLLGWLFFADGGASAAASAQELAKLIINHLDNLNGIDRLYRAGIIRKLNELLDIAQSQNTHSTRLIAILMQIINMLRGGPPGAG